MELAVVEPEGSALESCATLVGGGPLCATAELMAQAVQGVDF